MENKVIRVVSYNHQTFLSKVEDMNKRLAKRNLPLINAKLLEEYDVKTKEQVPVPYEPFAIQIDVVYHYFFYELSSEFDQKNIAGVDVQFEGVVDLVEKDENAKIFKLADSNLFKYLKVASVMSARNQSHATSILFFQRLESLLKAETTLLFLVLLVQRIISHLTSWVMLEILKTSIRNFLMIVMIQWVLDSMIQTM